MEKEQTLEVKKAGKKALNTRDVVKKTSKALTEALLLSFSYDEFARQWKSKTYQKGNDLKVDKQQNIPESKSIDANLAEYRAKVKEFNKVPTISKNMTNEIKKIQDKLLVSFMEGSLSDQNRIKFNLSQQILVSKYQSILTTKLRDLSTKRVAVNRKKKLLDKKLLNMSDKQRELMLQYQKNIYNNYGIEYDKVLDSIGGELDTVEAKSMENLVDNFFGLVDNITWENYDSKEAIRSKIYTESNEMSNKLLEYVDKSMFLDSTIFVVNRITKKFKDSRIEKYKEIGTSYGKKFEQLDVPKSYEYKLGKSHGERDNNTILPAEAFACLHHSLLSCSQDFKDQTWILQSSTSMFLTHPEYNSIPGDVDISMPRESFHDMRGKIRKKKHPILKRIRKDDIITVFDHNQEGKPIICTIAKDGTIVRNNSYKFKNSTGNNEKDFQQVINDGHIVMSYDTYNKDDIGMNIEIFSEGPQDKEKSLDNTGFAQPEQKDGDGDVYSSLYKNENGEKLKFEKKKLILPFDGNKRGDRTMTMYCMTDEMLSKYYTINLIYEIVLGDRVDTLTTKIKYNTRLKNLCNHLKNMGINIDNIIEKITETIKYFYKQGEWGGYAKKAMEAWFGNDITNIINKKTDMIIKSLIDKGNDEEYKSNIIDISQKHLLFLQEMKKTQPVADNININEKKEDDGNDLQERQNGFSLAKLLEYGTNLLEQLQKLDNKNDIENLIKKPHFASFIMKSIQNDSKLKGNENKYNKKSLYDLAGFYEDLFFLKPPGFELMGKIRHELIDIMKDIESSENTGTKDIHINDLSKRLSMFTNELVRHKTELKHMYNNLKIHREINKDISNKLNERVLFNVLRPRLEAIKQSVNEEWVIIKKDLKYLAPDVVFEHIASFHIFLKYYYNTFNSMITMGLIQPDDIH